jgi:acyl-coenzyme A thioesterase PaaI-like protein
MEEQMLKMTVESGCPFAQRSHMRFTEVAEDGNATMILEDDPTNYNAFGLIHAGAICGLVETTGGMAIFHYLDPRETIVLNTILNIRYIHMPVGELRCTARVTEAEARAVLEDFEAEGKADKTVDVKVFDTSGKMVAQAQATYRLMETPEQFKKYFSQMS